MPQNQGTDEVPKTRRQRRLAREQEAIAKEAKIQKQLKKRPKEDPLLPGTFGRFGRVIAKKAPKLFEKPWLGYMRQLDKHQDAWVRPIDKWKVKGKSPRTQFRSLVRHLLMKYDVPQFLMDAFMEETEHTRNIAIRLLIHVGQGGSLYKAVKPISIGLRHWKEAVLPVPLTKKMCKAFLRKTSDHGLVSAIRHSQVETYGGSPRIARALCQGTRMGEEITHLETFWDHVIQWLCQQPMLNPHEVGPITDWVARQRADNTTFSMKGRTGVSVLRAVEEWHGNLAKLKNHRQVVFKPCGIPPGKYERKINLKGGGFHMEEWTMVELLSSRELHAEGSKMGHCVFSYSRDIINGRCSIWSLRTDGVRQLTIEVMNQNKRIVQIAGRYNRQATDLEMRYVKAWAQKAALDISRSRWL